MANQRVLPYGLETDWLIAFIDVETTGLQPGYHEMVDIGIVMTDLDGQELSSFFRRIMPVYPERAEQGALDCNGFSVERWLDAGAVSPNQAVADIIQFYRKAAGNGQKIDKKVIFCAYNESFDYPFVDQLFRSSGQSLRRLHHYTLDLPSIAWGCGIHLLHCKKLVNLLGVKEEPMASNGADPWEHTGLTGARKNVRIYRALLNY